MKLTQSIRYVGVNDYDIDLFEGQYPVPQGISYNSYVILDEKIAVMDSVDAHFTARWLENLQTALEGRSPDYLVVQHMEPDHSGSIRHFLQAYPGAKLVASERAFTMMKNFFGENFPERRVAVGEGSVLELGSRTLRFLAAPMVHWPEVIMTYDSGDKVLFSADAFGRFGALDVEMDWADEARRYYIGIVGKYGIPVQNVLNKVSQLDVAAICPLHGPALTRDLTPYLELYRTWSGYEPEQEGVLVAYASIYGHTAQAARLLAEQLKKAGCPAVEVLDLARCDVFAAVAAAFRYSKLVLACSTYNGTMFPPMRAFLNHLVERGYTKRTVALVENGSWAPSSGRAMGELLGRCKDLRILPGSVRILSAMSEENREQLASLARQLCAPEEETEKSAAPGTTKRYVCKICGYVYEGEQLPADFVCPICKRGAEDFEEIK